MAEPAELTTRQSFHSGFFLRCCIEGTNHKGYAVAMKPNMDIKPLKSQRDYRRILKEIESLMNAKANTAQGDHLDVLVTLIEAWEAKHYPLDLPDAV
jgi:hypothetical protein